MPINVAVLTEEEFNSRLKELLIQLEDNRESPYQDIKNNPSSHPTIGIGFDLTVSTVREKVFAAMGIVSGSPTATALITAITNSIGKTDAQIQANLNAV